MEYRTLREGKPMHLIAQTLILLMKSMRPVSMRLDSALWQ